MHAFDCTHAQRLVHCVCIEAVCIEALGMCFEGTSACLCLQCCWLVGSAAGWLHDSSSALCLVSTCCPATELGSDGIVICGDVGLNMSCCMMFRIESSHAKGLTPFQDVRLGPLVGKGSFGKVYRGIWDNVIVAIKVSLLQKGLINMLLPMIIVHRLLSGRLQTACCDEGVMLRVRSACCFTVLSTCQDLAMHVVSTEQSKQ